MNQIVSIFGILSGLGIVSWVVNLLRPGIDRVFEQLEANTRNKNLLAAETWALQVVHNVENKMAEDQPAAKKDQAVKELTARLEDNLLDHHFSEEAVSGLIEHAVALMNGGK